MREENEKWWIQITFNESKIKIDIFSHAEENLFIDLLVSKDNDLRKTAWNFINNSNNYREKLTSFLEMEEDNEEYKKTESFLELKIQELDKNVESTREYMKLKFDYIDLILKDEKEKEKLIENLKANFPILWLVDNVDFDNFLEKLFKKEKDFEKEKEKLKEWKKSLKSKIFKIKKDTKIDDLKDKFLLVPFLIPEYKDETINWSLKTIKFKDKFDIKWTEEKLDLKILFKDYIILEKNDFNENEINYIYSKLDLFYDYRYIENDFFD